MPIFRSMKKQDAWEVAFLEQLSFQDAWTCNSILETYHQSQSFITVVEEEGKIIGYCIVYFVLDEGEIARIAVHPKMQHQGVGRGLLDYTCEIGAKKGIRCLMLDVRESNKTARKFYEQYGFKKDGVRKNFYEKPTENAILMSRQLEED